MPSLNFVLPHWLFWGTLIVFPLIAWVLFARERRRPPRRGPSLFVAYLLLITAGFVGLHRFYLRSLLGFVFIPIFLFILHTNDKIRDAREDVSRTRAAVEEAHHKTTRAQPLLGQESDQAAIERHRKTQSEEAKAKADFGAMQKELENLQFQSRAAALVMAALLVLDALLLPMLLSRRKREEEIHPDTTPEHHVPDIPPMGTREDPTLGLHTRITGAIEWVNTKTGEYVAYWAVIAVFAYYYEVVARYVFNSPTNWVHESMFLMFGMQYMLAGAYAYREDQHVRVDVFYSKFSPRGKAIADIITSVFFFIFVITMLVTGTRFALDAINNSEVSFTEWAVQYWPVKLMIPIGAGLLALQGVAKLIKDIVFVARGRA